MPLDSFFLNDTGGVDQRQMREPLREVADLPACVGVVLFSKQAEMIPDREQPFEQFLRFGLPSLEGVIVGEPEAARQEWTLIARQAIEPEFCGVSSDEPIAHEIGFDGVNRRHHSGIGGRQEANVRYRQHARVERVGTVRLRERTNTCVPPAIQYILVDPLAERVYMRQHGFGFRSAEIELLDQTNGAIDRDPGLDLRMREVAKPSAANLPDALIGPLPHLFEVSDHAQVNGPRLLGSFKPHLAGGIKTAESLAVNVDLELVPGAVPDAHGAGLLVTGQPVEFQLIQPSLSGNAVHDLKPRGITRDCARQPVTE